MLNERVCFSENLMTDTSEYCLSAAELFGSRSFYIYLERFSNTISKAVPEYNKFLNTYFSEQGYVDIWRILHLLRDLTNGKTEYHAALLNDELFRTRFMSFIGEFYNYCIQKGNLLSIESSSFTDFSRNMFYIRKNQCLYNLIAETYCKIYEKLNNYVIQKSEG